MLGEGGDERGAERRQAATSSSSSFSEGSSAWFAVCCRLRIHSAAVALSSASNSRLRVLVSTQKLPARLPAITCAPGSPSEPLSSRTARSSLSYHEMNCLVVMTTHRFFQLRRPPLQEEARAA